MKTRSLRLTLNRAESNWNLVQFAGRVEAACAHLHRPLQSLLNVHAFAHDRGVELALKGQQVHVGLRVRNEFAHLLRNDLVFELGLLAT